MILPYGRAMCCQRLAQDGTRRDTEPCAHAAMLERNETLILGFVWVLILRYQFKQLEKGGKRGRALSLPNSGRRAHARIEHSAAVRRHPLLSTRSIAIPAHCSLPLPLGHARSERQGGALQLAWQLARRQRPRDHQLHHRVRVLNAPGPDRCLCRATCGGATPRPWHWHGPDQPNTPPQDRPIGCTVVCARSWKDGEAFVALVEREAPHCVTRKDLADKTPVEKMDKAFDVAEDELGIPRLLDAADVAAYPDEKSILTYLSYFKERDDSGEAAKTCVVLS